MTIALLIKILLIPLVISSTDKWSISAVMASTVSLSKCSRNPCALSLFHLSIHKSPSCLAASFWSRAKSSQVCVAIFDSNITSTRQCLSERIWLKSCTQTFHFRHSRWWRSHIISYTVIHRGSLSPTRGHHRIVLSKYILREFYTFPRELFHSVRDLCVHHLI